MMRRGGSAVITKSGHADARRARGRSRASPTVEHVTHGLSLPPGACGSWTALYTGLRKFTDDLVAHMHLENAVLFPRFETTS